MMTEIYLQLNLVSGIFAALAALLVALGFVRLAVIDRGTLGHFAAGLLLIHLAVFMRTIYRDIAPGWFGPDRWATMVDATSHTSFTIFFNVLVLVSGYNSLKALLLAIPPEKRGRYSLLTAPLYPPWAVAMAPRALWRYLRGRRG